jgi:hypothetical protein
MPQKRSWKPALDFEVSGKTIWLADMRPGPSDGLKIKVTPGLYTLELMHYGVPQYAPIGKARFYKKGCRPVMGRKAGCVSIDMATLGICDIDHFLTLFNQDADAFCEWAGDHLDQRKFSGGGVCLHRSKHALPHITTGMGDGVYSVYRLTHGKETIGAEIVFLDESFEDVTRKPPRHATVNYTITFRNGYEVFLNAINPEQSDKEALESTAWFIQNGLVEALTSSPCCLISAKLRNISSISLKLMEQTNVIEECTIDAAYVKRNLKRQPSPRDIARLIVEYDEHDSQFKAALQKAKFQPFYQADIAFRSGETISFLMMFLVVASQKDAIDQIADSIVEEIDDCILCNKQLELYLGNGFRGVTSINRNTHVNARKVGSTAMPAAVIKRLNAMLTIDNIAKEILLWDKSHRRIPGEQENK